ncbi:VanW family protein [Thermopolyspora sp. NPDC052614]|uniref:VanW family protein n=1 Tax=Thermopolyspora sp. NPDC052614 TaxID=3155682 RepID=UPI0034178D62
MTNARASVDPPTDPFEAAPPPPARYPVRPVSKKLPPGVSPEIFQPGRGLPLPFAKPQQGKGGLPPAVPPVEPWPLKGPTLRERYHSRPAAQRVLKESEEPPKELGPGAGAESAASTGRARRIVILTALGALGLLLAYLVPAWLMSGKVLPGTTVAGIDVGGLTSGEAAERLNDWFTVRESADIAVKVGPRRFTVSPLKAGLTFDAAGTVAQLPTGFPGPGDVWRAITSRTPLQPQIMVNEAKLKEQVALIAAEVDRPLYTGAVVYRGREPVVVPPRDGVILDQAAAMAAIKKAYLGSGTPVELTLRTDPPTISAETIKQWLPEAREALSGPLTLVNGTRRVVLPVEVIAANLRFVPNKVGKPEPEFDARTAIEGVERNLLDPATAPRDATFGIVGGKPALVPGRAGQGVDTERLAASVIEALTGGGSRTIEVTLTRTRPRLDDAEATKLGIKEKVGAFTTRHQCCTPRTVNISKITELVDGHVVKPGETFSLNDLVGRPDRARGFVSGPAIENGRVVIRMGGGVSEFATALYGAVFHAGLKIVKREGHDFSVPRYPPGLDAALAYPDTDLRWRNDSKYGVFIHAVHTGTELTVELWSTRRYDAVKAVTSDKRDVKPFQTVADSGPDCVETPGANGFTVTVTRVFERDGAEVKRDKPVTTVYRPQPRVTCGETTTQAASGESDRVLIDSSERGLSGQRD